MTAPTIADAKAASSGVPNALALAPLRSVSTASADAVNPSSRSGVGMVVGHGVTDDARVGDLDGFGDGMGVGMGLGNSVGREVGRFVGAAVTLGVGVGRDDGAADGACVVTLTAATVVNSSVETPRLAASALINEVNEPDDTASETTTARLEAKSADVLAPIE